MRKQIREYIEKGPTCQRNKIALRIQKEPMVIITTASKAFKKIFLDIIRPLSRSNQGSSFILSLQDELTKLAWVCSTENHEANTGVYHFVTQFMCLHGFPQCLVTDCGILSKIFNKVYRLMKMHKSSTIPYHPLNNGSFKRSHRTNITNIITNCMDKLEYHTPARI